MLRLWLIVVLTLAGAFAPSRADARVAETCAQGFFATATTERPESAPQVAGMHQRFAACGYRSASGYSQAAESDAALLQGHLDNAIARFNVEGYTDAQAEALINNPQLADAFRGSQIDSFFKESVLNDPALSHLEVTPQFQFGPDVFNPSTQEWWDVTTPGQWEAHTQKYWLFGNGSPLFTK